MPQLSPPNLTKPRRQNSLLQVRQILKISLVLIGKTPQQNKARIDALCKIPYAYACPKTIRKIIKQALYKRTSTAVMQKAYMRRKKQAVDKSCLKF